MPGAFWPTWTVVEVSWTSKVIRVVSVGWPGAAVVTSAPHVPASGSATSKMYMPRSSGMVQMNVPSAATTDFAGSRPRS